MTRSVFLAMIGLAISLCLGQAASGPATASAPAERKALYSINFEDGKGVYRHEGKYNGQWVSNEEDVAKLSLDKPLGSGNDSKLALTVHTSATRPYVTAETNIKGLIVEPQGWDGGLKFRIYNGGFAEFYALYLPLMPSDITFHRAYFKAEKGKWTDVDLPLDKFLFHDRRPRRGCTLEIISIVGVGPEGDQSVFQFDDLELYQLKQANPPSPASKPALPEGVSYHQDFDDPADFDIESFYPYTRNANAFRLAADQKRQLTGKQDVHGCLKIECYSAKEDFKGGRQISFAAKGKVIEFDLLAHDATDVGLMFRSAKTRGRQFLQPQPQADKWSHYAISAEDFVPFDVEYAKGKDAHLSRDEMVTMLFFQAFSGQGKDGRPHLLIDNLKIRQAESK